MSRHPQVPYDPARVTEITARLDLRAPNAEALDVVARRFDTADGQPFEAVCDLATAVGKTYLAAGLVEYLADAGVRHILVVVPGATIQSKTVANFTHGHDRSLTGGMSCDPLVVTAENFNTGLVAAALDDDTRVKLYVFTVQSLIQPRTKTSRRVRQHQEWLGTGLYQRLQQADDLVVLADEHHVYTEKATKFNRAVTDLDPMAVIGLTATPNDADADKVVYRYPLARAIADQYVKTPVLVGRRDQLTGVDVQLRDGLRLLDAKQAAADAYADAIGTHSVNAVMFVVADTIDNANAIAETLRKPDLLGPGYDQQVLTVHSDAPDDALARLETVEDPASPVRVIVSVSMLKEGWDVKNIYVICSFRPSISDTLTEQTLGRGLRLPWGTYTGVELLDTVEVLSHERYHELLERAGVLLEGLTGERATPQVTTITDDTDGGEPAAVAVRAQTSAVPAGDRPAHADGRDRDDTGRAGGPPADGAQVGDDDAEPGFVLAGMDQRTADADVTVASLREELPPARDVHVPKLQRLLTARTFSLSDIDDDTFRQLGRRLAAEGGTNLDRKVLQVVDDPSAPSGMRLVPRSGSDDVAASPPNLPYEQARQQLVETVLSFDEVEQTRGNLNAAGRLADAVIDGAGSEEALAAQFNAVLDAVRITVRQAHRTAPATYTETWTSQPFAPRRVNHRPVEDNRFGPFSRDVAYAGWLRSLHKVNWFDSEPERRLANLVDDDQGVELWARILRGELVVPWQGGQYNPDFYVLSDDVHHLVEVKADRSLHDDDVAAKAAAAQAWARKATDDGGHGTWRYVLVGETAVRTAPTFAGLVAQAT